MDARRVVIGCAADGAYALPLAVMLRSAASRLAADHTLEVYAVDAGIAAADRARIERSIDERAVVRWVAPERAAFTGLPLWGRMPITTYDKLAIARWLPDSVDRVLWLDADLLVLDDLAALWAVELGDAVLAATQDTRVPTVDARFGIAPYAALGLAPGGKYFNAGVLAIDLKRWRELDVEGRALAYLRRHGARVYFWDQEALNVVLASRWVELSPRWNWSPTTGHADAASPADTATPHILHFSGNLKPWRYAGRGTPYALYYRDLDQTAWAGWRPRPSWWAEGVNLYESSGLRRFGLPFERWVLSLLRASTLRYASPADLVAHEPSSPGAAETR